MIQREARDGDVLRHRARALFAEHRADVLATGASGAAGGVTEKVLAALDLGMKVVVIRRPDEIDAGAVSTLEAAVEAVRKLVPRRCV